MSRKEISMRNTKRALVLITAAFAVIQMAKGIREALGLRFAGDCEK